MPTYEYACTSCGERLETFVKFGDPEPTECPVCGGALRKVFHPAGILFKGSGFYKTDSRSSSKAADRKPSEPKSEPSSKSASSESGPKTPAADSKAPASTSTKKKE